MPFLRAALSLPPLVLTPPPSHLPTPWAIPPPLSVLLCQADLQIEELNAARDAVHTLQGAKSELERQIAQQKHRYAPLIAFDCLRLPPIASDCLRLRVTASEAPVREGGG